MADPRQALLDMEATLRRVANTEVEDNLPSRRVLFQPDQNRSQAVEWHDWTELKFSVDQPRDEGGRWTSDGGGGAAKPDEGKYFKQPPPSQENRNEATYKRDKQMYDDLGAYPTNVDDEAFNGRHSLVDQATGEMYEVEPRGIFKNMTEIEGTRRPLDYVYRS